MELSWCSGRSSAQTFSIRPVREFVSQWIGDGRGWIDPYAGDNPLGIQFSNDHNPDCGAENHMEAVEFCRAVVEQGLVPRGGFAGVVYDPPYSYRQVSEHYRARGMRATRFDTSNQFYNRVKNAVCDHIAIGGFAISCGWNSNGFGWNRGFAPVHLLVVRHGQHKNDTLVLVEVRVSRSEDMP